MNPILIKGLIGLGGAGITGAGIYGSYLLLRPKTIREKMEWQGESFPSTGEDESNLGDWKKLAEENGKATGDDKVEGVNGTDNGDQDNSKAKKMREGCKKLMDKSVEDATEQDYKKAKRCTLGAIPKQQDSSSN